MWEYVFEIPLAHVLVTGVDYLYLEETIRLINDGRCLCCCEDAPVEGPEVEYVSKRMLRLGVAVVA